MQGAARRLTVILNEGVVGSSALVSPSSWSRRVIVYQRGDATSGHWRVHSAGLQLRVTAPSKSANFSTTCREELMRLMSQASVLAGVIAGMLVMPLSPAHAQADFYKGKTISIVIGREDRQPRRRRAARRPAPGQAHPRQSDRHQPADAGRRASQRDQPRLQRRRRRRPDHPGGQSERRHGPAREAAERPLRRQQVHLARLVRARRVDVLDPRVAAVQDVPGDAGLRQGVRRRNDRPGLQRP